MSRFCSHGVSSSTPLPAHHLPNGRGFQNPWPSFHAEHNFMGFLKCFLVDWEHSRPKPSALPLSELDHVLIQKGPANNEIQVTWIGHSSSLIQMGGYNILVDPIFSERCSAWQKVGPWRRVPPAIIPTQLPRIHAVCISHNHYDHLDLNSVREIAGLPEGGRTQWFVPLGLKSFLTSDGIDSSNVHELDWWQEKSIATLDGESTISLRAVCCPTQHFSGRGILDRMKSLWCSWALIVDGLPTPLKFWFSGDTGYRSVPRGLSDEEERKTVLPVCPAFAEIGSRVGPFHLSCIAIGAYSPRWFMSPVHLNPRDAVAIHKDIRSLRSVAVHWGTFVLTDEPFKEPPELLRKEAESAGLSEHEFVAVKHGHTVRVAVDTSGADSSWVDFKVDALASGKDSKTVSNSAASKPGGTATIYTC